MKKLLASWVALGRHLRPGALVRDGVLLMVIGALAAFALLYAGRLAFDRTVFAIGLNYAAQQSGRHAGGLTLEKLKGYSVAALHVEGSSPYDPTRDATPVMTYDSSSVDAVARLMGRLARQGKVAPDGVLVDEAAAARMSVRPGDSVTLTCDDSGDAVVLRVAAVLAPFHEADDYGNGGLVVLPRTMLPADGTVVSTTTYFLDATPDGAREKWRDVAASVGRDLTLGPLVLGLLVIGLALWCVALARVASEITAGLRTSLNLLLDLGVHPRIGRAFVVGLVGALALASGTVAALAARQLVTAWTSFYITPQQIGAVAVTLAIAALIVARLVLAAPHSRSPR